MTRLGRLTYIAMNAGFAAAAVALAGCSSGSNNAATSSSGGGPPENPTFHKDIEPILQQHCQSCHTAGHIAPFALVTYADAKPLAGNIVTQTKARTMPPFAAQSTDECQPRLGWRDDPRLTDVQIATLAAWEKAGAPEGDPSDAPPPYTPPEDGLPGMQQSVQPKTPFVTSGDTDQFRCFAMDPGLTEDKYLNGSHFVAGDPKVVHHALMFLDTNGDSDKLAGPDGSYECFGSPGLSSTQLIAAWAPGGVPNEYASNIGLLLPKGSKLVMQVHYHPAGAPAAMDSTAFQMRFTSGVPEYVAAVALIGNFPSQGTNGDGLQPGPDDTNGVEFRIPAGAKGHTETMQLTLPMATTTTGAEPTLYLYGVGTHMHYVGTDMKISLTRPNPTDGQPAEECFLQTPHWDFNWQRFYTYDAAVTDLPSVHGGEVLHLRCTYDNTTSNPFVMRALTEQKLTAPKDVVLGETTLDEMCLGAFSIVAKNATP